MIKCLVVVKMKRHHLGCKLQEGGAKTRKVLKEVRNS